MVSAQQNIKPELMESRNYSRAFLAEFIETYKSLPCLWKVKSKEYSDRNKKTAAYDVLIQKLKEVEEDVNRNIVVKKINNLRSSYRKELRKVAASKNSGAEGDEIYTPQLWYYSLLSFLNQQEDDEENSSKFNIGDDYDQMASIGIHKVEVLSPTTSHCDEGDDFINRPPSPASSTNTQPHSRKRIRDEFDIPLREPLAKISDCSRDDEFELIAKNIAMKLKNMANVQRIFAEKFINDVLFEAQLGNLNRKCKFITADENLDS